MGYKVAWRSVLEKYDYRCYYCGVQSLRLIREHKIPYARGGRTSRDNLVPACISCNVRKGTSTAEEFVAVIDMQARARRWQEPPLSYEELVALDPTARLAPSNTRLGEQCATEPDDSDDVFVRHSPLIFYAPKIVLMSRRLSPLAKLFYFLLTMGEHPIDPEVNDHDPTVTPALVDGLLRCSAAEHDSLIDELVSAGLMEMEESGLYSVLRPGQFDEEEQAS